MSLPTTVLPPENEPKPIITLLSMKKMEERLPDHFMRIHRSYIINLTKIMEVNKNRVIMDADTYLPIGDMYRDTFQKYLDIKKLKASSQGFEFFIIFASINPKTKLF